MMTYLLISAISLAILAGILFFPYNSFRIDRIRQELFALRDELFDEAARGRIGFESKAYWATRTMLNGAIRFSHRLSFGRLVAHRALMTPREAPDLFDAAFSAASKDDRELCAKYLVRANEIVIRHVMSSPIVLMVLVPHVLIVACSRLGVDVVGAILKRFSRQLTEFDRIAFREGQASQSSS